MNCNLVVHIIIGLNVGGAETALKKLILPNKSKYTQVIISLTDRGFIGNQLEENGVEVYTLGMTSFFSSMVALVKLFQLLSDLKPEIVHCWMYHANLIGGLAAKIADVKHIIWGIRSSRTPTGKPITYGIMKAGAWLSGFIPSKILCVANFAKETHKNYGYDEKKMMVINNGFDQSYFTYMSEERNRIRRSLGLGDQHTIIGSVGRFHYDKGQDVLIEAAKKLISKHKAVVIVLVGRDCDTNNKLLTNQIYTAGLVDHVILQGEKQNIPAYLSAFDVYCMPSRTEGFPNGLGEAMAVGLPCVATHVGDAKFLLDDTGLIAQEAEADALAEALQCMLDLPKEKRKYLGERAAQRIANHFTLEKTCHQTFSLYQELLEP